MRNASCACRRPAATAPLCSPADLPRSYTLPPAWPYPPLHLVMESAPQSCDLYSQSDFCCKLSCGRHFEPEFHVREAIAAALAQCNRRGRQCTAVDLGANNGWMSLYMLSLGARVISAEMQPDLATALRRSVQLNCFERSSVVHNVRVAASDGVPPKSAVAAGWRAGGHPGGRKALRHAPAVGTLAIGALLRPLREIDLIKMDADGPEGDWLLRIEELMASAALIVRNIIVECSGCSPEQLWRLQRHEGYDVFKLNMHDDRRFLDERGHDVYADWRSVGVDELEDWYGLRGIKHAYRVRRNTTLDGWQRVFASQRAGASATGKPFPPQFWLTHEDVWEQRHPHPKSAALHAEMLRRSGRLGEHAEAASMSQQKDEQAALGRASATEDGKTRHAVVAAKRRGLCHRHPRAKVCTNG